MVSTRKPLAPCRSLKINHTTLGGAQRRRCAPPFFSEFAVLEPPMSRTEYFLRDHAFLSVGGKFCIILDVKMDRYLCIDMREFRLLKPYLHGWQLDDGPGNVQNGGPVPPNGARLAADLMSKGVISNNTANCKDVAPTSWMLPTRTLVGSRDQISTAYALAHVASFLVAAATASHQLKRQTFESTVNLLSKRKRCIARANSEFDLHKAARLTLAFNKLRPVFPRNYLCLFDSLALILFLSYYDLFPTLVFGVKHEPFAAHCWVQAGEVVLNDTLAYTTEFTPIMTI